MPAGIRVGSCLYSRIAAGLVFVLPAFFGLNAICPRCIRGLPNHTPDAHWRLCQR